MEYYCCIIGFNSKKEISVFRPKFQTKIIATKIAEDLKKSYKLVAICHNKYKAQIFLNALKSSEFLSGGGKVISII